MKNLIQRKTLWSWAESNRRKSLSNCPLFESDVCDCIALFDALTTTTAAAVHDLVWGCHPTFVLCFFASW